MQLIRKRPSLTRFFSSGASRFELPLSSMQGTPAQATNAACAIEPSNQGLERLSSGVDWSSQTLEIPGPSVIRGQQLLFPLSAAQVCSELRIPLSVAEELHRVRLLSFAPAQASRLDEAQECELRFLGTLMTAGCSLQTLTWLLASLPRPYCYDIRQMYFDFAGGVWRALPDTQSEAAFTRWLDELVRAGDAGTLSGIIELASEALERVSGKL